MSNGFDPSNQKKLMEMVVGQVLKKHKVSRKDIKLSKKEKEEIKEIVGNIEDEVQRFLENQNKQLTERDFANENTTQDLTNENKAKQPVNQPTPPKRSQIFQSQNDIKSVKTFLNPRRKK
ncbi:hypothetical protein [Alkalihalobacterium alkalinitrilicum]|uniref:hypothetical protein n=1 Tax=Alkalihalobacterium alkalinitrilicum TaxID=427920 RepID=UPI00099577A4|nr:hypothetical protein [Alkalihalobacterium alkalinitrilicum]